MTIQNEILDYEEQDEILKTYKFCNSYRVNDRVSQYLLKKMLYIMVKIKNDRYDI